METLLEILKDIKPGVNFEEEKHLATGGILRSFDILSLIAEIGEEMDVEIGFLESDRLYVYHQI